MEGERYGRVSVVPHRRAAFSPREGSLGIFEAQDCIRSAPLLR